MNKIMERNHIYYVLEQLEKRIQKFQQTEALCNMTMLLLSSTRSS